jgi:hypothetical protein
MLVGWGHLDNARTEVIAIEEEESPVEEGAAITDSIGS